MRARSEGLSGVVAVALAALACYGTLAAAALLSALGIALAVNEAAVGALVASLAVAAALVVGVGARLHRSPWPAALGAAGALLVAGAMLVAYDWRIELGGFALLFAAAVWDRRLRRARTPR